MQTIGERLEEARKRKGISLREAAEATKIRGDYLLKFEGNQYDLNLPEIYVRGFLRTYAGFLKLSVDKITADFAALGHGAARSSPRMPSREIYGRMDLSVASGPSATAGEGQPAADAEPATPEQQPPPRRMPQPFRNNLPSPGIPLDVILKFSVILIGAVLLIVLIGWGAKEVFFTAAKKTQPAVTTGEIIAAQPIPEQTITLTALGPVDVQVKQEIDGKIIYRGTLAAGDRIPIVKRGAVFITYTAGKNLQIEINSRVYGMPTTGYDRARIE